MKIAIDCRMIRCSGIGTFIQGVLPHIIQSDSNEILLVGDIRDLECYWKENVSFQDCTIPIFSLKELFRFPVERINQCDVFFSPNYNLPLGVKIPIVSTIHDVIFLDVDNLCSDFGKLIRHGFLKYAISKSDRIITPSEFSKSRIKFHFSTTKPITVCYNGLSEKVKEFTAQNCPNTPKDEYIVFVGNIKKHKGLETLVSAYNLAKKRGLHKKLFIVGNKDNFKTAADFNMSLENESIVFTGYLDDESLLSTIHNASALIQPSLYEGFGIPPLEAMALGTPAIISDIPVFKEIYEDYPVSFFHAGDVNDLANALLMDLQKINLDKSLIEKYTYQQTAQTIIKELQSV